jgi:hypothetical protein
MNNTNGTTPPGEIDLQIPPLTEPERLWLTELYELSRKGERFTYRDIWAKLATKIPQDFKPQSVDDSLMSNGGSRIMVLGVAALQGNYQIIEQINRIITAIRKIILHNASIVKITIEEIANECQIPSLDVSISLDLAQLYVSLYSSSTYKNTSTILDSIDVSGNQEIFYNYLHFKGIQFYLHKAYINSSQNNGEYFSKSEIKEMNEKLDQVLEMLKNVVLSQQFTYDDVMEEINDLREMYGLKKKDWKRLFVAKVTDMTTGGIVSVILSEPIADEIKPIIKNLLK